MIATVIEDKIVPIIELHEKGGKLIARLIVMADEGPRGFAQDLCARLSASEPPMICTGCGSTETLAELKARHPTSLSCCPERKMVPNGEAFQELARGLAGLDDAPAQAAQDTASEPAPASAPSCGASDRDKLAELLHQAETSIVPGPKDPPITSDGYNPRERARFQRMADAVIAASEPAPASAPSCVFDEGCPHDPVCEPRCKHKKPTRKGEKL